MAERDVLVVDDERQVREVLQQILTLSGYTCRLVGDGGEALEVFKVWRPPLVVTDVLHPGINGIELLRQVRALDGDVAVIVLTGAASKDGDRVSEGDRKSTRLNSSHGYISYAVFCLKKKKNTTI